MELFFILVLLPQILIHMLPALTLSSFLFYLLIFIFIMLLRM